MVSLAGAVSALKSLFSMAVSETEARENRSIIDARIAEYVRDEWDGDPAILQKLTSRVNSGLFAGDAKNMRTLAHADREEQYANFIDVLARDDDGALRLGSGGPLRRYMTPCGSR